MAETQDFWGWPAPAGIGTLTVDPVGLGGGASDGSDLFLHIPQILVRLGSGEFGDQVNALGSSSCSFGSFLSRFCCLVESF